MIDITTEKHKNYILVRIEENINVSNAGSLKSKLLEIVKQKSDNVLLDLTKIKYIDSTGIGIIIYIKKELETAGKKYAVFVGDNMSLEDIFLLTKMDKYVDILHNQEEIEKMF
jgi:anti-sigma B factor antagonist